MKMHSNIYGWDYVWRDFADDKGGKVVADDSQPGAPVLAIHVPLPGSKDVLTFKPWLPSGKKAFEATFATISYPSDDQFAFAIWTEGKMDQLHKMLGMQDVRVGHEKFDKKFIVQSNNESLVKKLFSDAELIDILLDQPTCELRLVPDASEHFPDHNIPQGHNAILYAQDQLVDKFENLDAIVNTLGHVLVRLHAVLTGAPDVQSNSKSHHQQTEPDTGSHRKLHSPLLD